VLHRQKTQAQWRRRNRGYAIAYRIDQRATQTESPAEPMRVPAPLDRLPWEFAKDEFGSQRADFIGVMGALMVRTAKDEFRAYLVDPTRLSGTLPPPSRKTSSDLGHRNREPNMLSQAGPTGVGKTGLACGLLLKALQNGYRCQFICAQGAVRRNVRIAGRPLYPPATESLGSLGCPID